jgi:hypothetical protein
LITLADFFEAILQGAIVIRVGHPGFVGSAEEFLVAITGCIQTRLEIVHTGGLGDPLTFFGAEAGSIAKTQAFDAICKIPVALRAANVLLLLGAPLLDIAIGKAIQAAQELAVASDALNGLLLLWRQGGVVAGREFVEAAREGLGMG